LAWGDEKDVPRDFTRRIGDHLYFRRRDSGACVFLDETTGACRIHARFGSEVKALNCRGYPYNIASTWRDEASVVARLDCPAVRRNQGPPLATNRREIEGLVAEVGGRNAFTATQLDGLSREAVELVTSAMVRLVTEGDAIAPGSMAYILFLAAERFRTLGRDFLNDTATLREVMPTTLTRLRQDGAVRRPRALARFSRALFREWLATWCRCDEELVRTGPLVRLRRTAALAGYLFGAGSLRLLSQDHPDIPLSQVRLFDASSWDPSAPADWECFRRLLVARLEGPQFFGVAYYGQPFFTGLRALVQSYALALAAARCHAAARQSRRVEAEDVDYGVGTVDHALGRSPLLQLRAWRLVEDYFSGPRYAALLTSLGWE
jgi:Fe-S-cluster containining protein